MKKYLLTGVLALVVGSFLTSCHDDEIEYSSLAEAKKAQFAENFEKFFGKVSPNQSWGFGSGSATARTRTTDPDANMWGGDGAEGSRYPNFSVPQPLTDAQKTVVRKWFQTHQNPSSQAVNFSNFFVQQVYQGGTKTDDGSHTTEIYLAGNGDLINSGRQLDYLMAGATGTYTAWDGSTQYSYDHMYNFNGANYSGGCKNVDVWDGKLDPDATKDFNDRKIYHEDQIQLLVNSSTSSFGYHTSQSSQDFHDKYVIIPGDWIDPIVAGMWFVGFDYEATGENPNQYIMTEDANGEIEYNGKRYRKGGADGYYSDWIVRITPGNGTSITTTHGGDAGSDTNNTEVYKKKYVMLHKWVFCEDLGSSNMHEDFDYNDLVFDVKLIQQTRVVRRGDVEEEYTGDNPTTYYAEVTPLAAGGELAIKFEKLSKNIHAMFTPEEPDNILLNTARPHTTLITPHMEDLIGNTYEIEIEAPSAAQSADELKAIINNLNILVHTTSVVYDLKAYQGEAPHKILVDPGTRWPYERTAIDIAYTGFLQYVEKGDGFEPWKTTAVEQNLYPLTDQAIQMSDDKTGKPIYVKDYENSSSSTIYTLTPSNTEVVAWTEVPNGFYLGTDWGEGHHQNKVIAYTDLAKVDNNLKSFGVGSIIRAYFIPEDGYNVQLFTQDDANGWNWSQLIDCKSGTNDTHVSGNAGYVEYTVTQHDFEILQRGSLAINGIKATLVGVTVDNTNAAQSTTGPVFTTTGTSIADYSSNPQTTATIGADKVSDVGENSTFFVYGVGDGSVTASTNGTTINPSARTRSAEKSISFTINANQAASIRQNGITFTGGENFKIYKVTINKQTYTAPSDGNGDVIPIWSGNEDTDNNWATIYTGNGNKFNNAKPGDCLRITATIKPGSGWWQFNLANTAYEEINDYIKDSTSGQTLSTLGYQDIVLDQTDIDRLKKGGLMSYKSNLIFTKVELIVK